MAVIQNINFFGSKDKLIGSAPRGSLHEDHRFRIETLNVVDPVWQDEPEIGDIVTVTGERDGADVKLNNMRLKAIEDLGASKIFLFERVSKILKTIEIERRARGKTKIVSTASIGYLIFRHDIYFEVAVHDPTHQADLQINKFYWLKAKKGLKNATRLRLTGINGKTAIFRHVPVELDVGARSVDDGETELMPILAGMPWQNEFSYGAGVDAETGATTGRAVKRFEATAPPGKTSAERIHFVQSESDLTREIEVSASAQYNVSSIKISASTEYLSKITYSDLSVTIIAKYESANDAYDEADDYALTKTAKKLMEEDPELFRKAYGDYFVAGAKRASRFLAVYDCRSSSYSNMEEFKATIGIELPNIFSAEGSVRFMQAASETETRYNVSVFMEGYDQNAPNPPQGPWTPEKVLEALNWFKEHEVGVPTQAKLMHYSTLAPKYKRTIDIGPPAFVEIQRLYSSLWALRARYGTAPKLYQDRLSREFGDLDREIIANQGTLPTDADLRADLQIRADTLSVHLNAAFDRFDFYSRVVNAIPSEPEPFVQFRAGGQRDWLYGFDVYPRSDRIVIQSTVLEENKTWDHKHHQHTFDWSDSNAIIVGWMVTAVWNEPTSGVWEMAAEQILAKRQALVRVTSDYLRGYYWRLTVYWVDAADYQFDP